MIDLFTYFIYLALFLSLVLLTSYRPRYATNELAFEISPTLNQRHLAALLIISFIVGFRYGVGVDWEGYTIDFNIIKYDPSLEYNYKNMDFGFFYISKIIANFGLSYEWLFFTMALISWCFIFKSVPNLILPLLIFFLFVDEYLFWSMNGVRQFVAMSIWILAIKYIINRDLTKYLSLLFIACLFHRSVLLLLPLYFLPYHKISNKHLWLILFIISLIIGNNDIFINTIESIIHNLSQKMGMFAVYEHHIFSQNLFIDEEKQIGLGFIFKVMINLFLILTSGIVIKRNPQTAVYFTLFFIGAILFNLSYNIHLMGRFNNYFIIIRSVVLAISVYYFWQIPKTRVLVIGLCSFYFFLFLTAIYNSSNMCSPYRFSFLLN